MKNLLLNCALCRCLIIILGPPLLVLVLVLLTTGWWLPAIGSWLHQSSQPAPAEVIVVLAGDRERIVEGIALYKQGLADEIWYTGNVTFTTAPIPNESQVARQYAIDQGVPAEAITLLPSTSTWEDALAIRAQMDEQGVQHILLVTSWYHSRRSLCIMRHHLELEDGTHQLSWYSAPTDSYHYGPSNWWQHEHGLVQVQNEFIKFGFYWLTYGLCPLQC
jgi:uncharacterized SAM-binding protein YcdF (DUF218 family)